MLLFTGRHFWNRKCRKKTWWQQEFAVFKCEATVNSVTGHVCVNSNTQVNIAALDKERQAVTNRRIRTGKYSFGIRVAAFFYLPVFL